MITANVYHRVFQVKFGESTGTMFAIDVDNKQYLVTARHVFENSENSNSGQVFFLGEWYELPLVIVGISDVADIAVLATNFRISPAHPMEATNKDIIWGQDVYFLGFPYGWRAELNQELNRGFAFPFVKKAVLSAISTGNGFDQLFLDGHNNPGFSGGPVVYRPHGSDEFKVAAVISGYRYTEEPVFSNGNIMPLVYRYNTGIILSHSIDVANALILSNPIGFPLKNE